MIINEKFELVVKSQVCLTPSQCYQVDTFIPWYVTLLLASTIYLLTKDLLKK